MPQRNAAVMRQILLTGIAALFLATGMVTSALADERCDTLFHNLNLGSCCCFLLAVALEEFRCNIGYLLLFAATLVPGLWLDTHVLHWPAASTAGFLFG
jgi:hypothetical protein